jgi:hypothetical protein
MNRHRQRVIALTASGILVAVLGAGGGWWVAQRGQEEPAASGGTAASSTIRPLTPTLRGPIHRTG